MNRRIEDRKRGGCDVIQNVEHGVDDDLRGAQRCVRQNSQQLLQNLGQIQTVEILREVVELIDHVIDLIPFVFKRVEQDVDGVLVWRWRRRRIELPDTGGIVLEMVREQGAG